MLCGNYRGFLIYFGETVKLNEGNAFLTHSRYRFYMLNTNFFVMCYNTNFLKKLTC